MSAVHLLGVLIVLSLSFQFINAVEVNAGYRQRYREGASRPDFRRRTDDSVSAFNLLDRQKRSWGSWDPSWSSWSSGSSSGSSSSWSAWSVNDDEGFFQSMPTGVKVVFIIGMILAILVGISPFIIICGVCGGFACIMSQESKQRKKKAPVTPIRQQGVQPPPAVYFQSQPVPVQPAVVASGGPAYPPPATPSAPYATQSAAPYPTPYH